MAIGKTIKEVGTAAQSTQQSLKQEVGLTAQTVGMGREFLYASRAFGVLLGITFVLLIVLEVQWIRYWGRKLASDTSSTH
jgi:hypothetical protein